MSRRNDLLNIFLLTLSFTVIVFQFAVDPPPAYSELSEIVIDEDEDMAAVPLPETYTFTGAARHSIPIDVPPGRNGIHPNLALMYNSFWKNGWMGVGWRLSERTIRRATKHGVNFNGDDFVYVNNGRQSELTRRNEWGSEFFGTKIESEFTRYRFLGVSGGWEVTERNGTTYTYGTSSGSRQYDPGSSSRVYKWYLDRVEDSNGNYMTFSYLKNQGQVYLKQIVYTGNTNAGVTGTYDVQFELQNRSDVAVSYKSRFAVTTAKRLKWIKLYYDHQLIKKYRLEYTTGNSSGRSRLHKLTVFGSDGSSLPGTSFLWKESGGGTFTYNGFSGFGGNNINFADLNGDGFTDAVARKLDIDHWDGGYAWTTSVSVQMNNALWAGDTGNEFSGGETFIIDTGSSINNTSELAPIGLGDIDGDGFSDLITVGNVWRSKGDGTFKDPVSTSTPTENICVGDIDGDGLMDVAGDTVAGHYQWEHSITVHLSNGNGTFRPADTIFQESGWGSGEYPEKPTLKPLHLADINGDGYADLIKQEKHKLWIYLSRGNGTFKSEYSLNMADPIISVSFGDVNGDGLNDLIARCHETIGFYSNTNINVNVYVYLSKGNGGFEIPKSLQLAYRTSDPPRSMSVGDVNGDGRADLVVGKSLYPYGVDTYLAKVDGSFENALNSAPESRDGIYLADINGDGRADLIDYRPKGIEYYLSDGSSPKPDLLRKIKTDTGATMTIDYLSSTSHDNPMLPFTFQLVSAITVDDGLGSVAKTSYNTYSGGYYDYPDREFRGFRSVEQTNPDYSILRKIYHQDDFRKGNEKKVVFKDPDENTLSETYFTWEEIPETRPWGFVRLNRKRTNYYDNSAVFRQEDYTYHSENGHLYTLVTSGDGAAAVARITEYQNKGEWVWRLEKETLKNATGDIIRQTIYSYKSITGNLESQEQVLELPGAGQNPITQYGYDPDGYGNVISIIDPNGNPKTIIYDSTTHTYPEKVIYPQTGCEKPAGCVNHTVEYKHNYHYGKVSDKKDENGNRTFYHYDPFGRLAAVLKPDGGRKSVFYHDEAAPRYVLTKVQESETSTIDNYTYYDGLNRRIEDIARGDDGRTIVTVWHYDNMGRQDRIDGPFFSNQTNYLARTGLPSNIPYRKTTYDYRGRPIRIEQPLGNSVKGGGTAITRYAYNGFSVTVTDPDGSMKTTRRDCLDRIREVVEHTDQGEQHTYYDYNAAGDLEKVTNHLNRETNIAYDKLGRKVWMDDPDMGLWHYPEYDKNGNLIQQIDAKGQKIRFAYDALNRLNGKTYESSPDPAVKYTYDNPSIPNGTGRLYSVNKTGADDLIIAGTIYDAYDETGRVLSVTKTIDGAPLPFYTTSYRYDLSGKIISMTYPDMYRLLFTYHPGSELLYQVTGPEHDHELYAELTAYEPTGKIGKVYLGNGSQSDYFYDAASNRLLAIQSKDTELNMIQDKGYQYSPAGDIRQIIHHLTGVTYSYTYDKLHRLRSETNSGAADSFEPAILESSFAAAAPFHAPDNIEFNGVVFSYEYDENGNMTSGPDFSDPALPAMRSLTYNADNMPMSIVHSKGNVTNTIAFEYDGESRRVKKTVNGNNRTYYIGEHFEVRNGMETKYIFAGNLRIAKITSSDRYFFHKDHLGSSTVTTDYPNGEVLERTEYLPYGTERTQLGINIANYKFTDQEMDHEAGLYNYDARLYDPVVGRFITADTIVPGGGYDPQILNRYSYVSNNPLKYTDPSGHHYGANEPGGKADFGGETVSGQSIDNSDGRGDYGPYDNGGLTLEGTYIEGGWRYLFDVAKSYKKESKITIGIKLVGRAKNKGWYAQEINKFGEAIRNSMIIDDDSNPLGMIGVYSSQNIPGRGLTDEESRLAAKQLECLSVGFYSISLSTLIGSEVATTYAGYHLAYGILDGLSQGPPHTLIGAFVSLGKDPALGTIENYLNECVDAFAE